VSLFLQALDRLCKWLGILLLAAPVWWLAVARIDVPLDAEARRWADVSATSISPEQNAYYAIIGFYAEDPAVDINQIGQRMFARYLERLRAKPALQEYKYAQERRVVVDPAELCSPAISSCLQTAVLRRDELQHGLEQNGVLLSRYYSLYNYTHYREIEPIAPSRPLASAPLQIHNLVLARIALQAAQGEPRAALNDLARDTEFWRMVLRDDGRLLGKLSSTRALRDNQLLLSEIIASAGTAEQQDPAIERMLRPLDAQDLDLGPAMSFECHSFAAQAGANFSSGLDEGAAKYPLVVRAAARWLVSTAYRPNHTANLFQQQCNKFERWGKTHWNGELPAPGVDWRYFGESVWDILYNPAGKLLVYDIGEGPTTFASYRSRVSDLDGLVRLVTLQWLIKRGGVRPEDVPTLLRQAEPGRMNPYSGESMNWDSERGVLWFKRYGMNRHESDRQEIPVFVQSGVSREP
jgi:hypothetical protein